ncbi:hypothetical protein [Desulfosediminicola sp.]|uniref:hypothetical protein n=1 Tax=Desulfosediminicola sp. TaxID=2886825 RepID=UPI003AF2E2AC
MHDFQGRSQESPFRVIAELDPPKGANLESFLDFALQIRGRVDSIRITDCENAIMRMSPIAPCLTLSDIGFTPQMVINGRDRNRISFQADLLAAAALGVKEVVLQVGHDTSEGDQPMAKSSGDLDMPAMIKCATSLTRGRDLAGEELDGSTAYEVGVSLELSDDAAVNRKLAESFPAMADQGVRSVTLGPTYDLNILELFVPAAEQNNIRLYTSIMFLKSVVMIRYLNNLPGVPSVPQEYLKKMMDAPVKRNAGMHIAAELYRELQTMSDGTVLVAIGLGERLPEFLTMIGR